MDPQTATDYALQYGVVGLIALVFAIVIIFLFKRSDKRDEAIAIERKLMVEKEAAWKTERLLEAEKVDKREIELRLEYEEKHRELIEKHYDTSRQDRHDSRAHEDAIRREFAQIMETVESQAAKSSAATTAVLEKLHDRFVGPRARRRE